MAQHVAVVGLGFVGRTTLRYLAGAGIAVRGYDRSEAAARAARQALADELGPEASWDVGTDPGVVAAAEAVFVAVRLTRDDEGRFASEPLQEVAAMLRRHGSDGQIVLIESTLPPGTTRRFATWLDRPGIDIAHAPERLRVGDGDAALRAVPRLVGGLTTRSTERGCALLVRIGLRPVPVIAPEVSELSKLLENAFLTHKHCPGRSRLPGWPSRSECPPTRSPPLPRPSRMASWRFIPVPGSAAIACATISTCCVRPESALGLVTPMLDGIAELARTLPELVVERLRQRLGAGRGLAGARVLLVGVGFKPGSPDLTETPAVPICRLLRAAGCDVSYLDRLVPEFVVDGTAVPRSDPGGLGAASLDAIVVLSGERSIAVEELRASGACLLDAGGGATMAGAWRADERL